MDSIKIISSAELIDTGYEVCDFAKQGSGCDGWKDSGIFDYSCSRNFGSGCDCALASITGMFGMYIEVPK